MPAGTAIEATPPPLAEWKLAPPRARPRVVRRPRLFAALDRRYAAALTLVTAPAGSGKTELLVSWLDARPELAAAWVSSDAADTDPRRFWTYVAHAVDRVRPGMARPALARLRTPGVSVEEAIDELMNGIGTFAGRLVIAVDDLHHFASRAEAASLAYAVDHLPAPARIVATTRADPVVRLGRLRARGAVAELRSDRLAFTLAEARELLVDHMGIDDLAPADVELLVGRTEGWPAGLSLAGMWLSEADDRDIRVRTFSGDNRDVADYLTGEVLETLDEETRRFMVRTSALERLCGSLCDAALATTGSGERLETLARSNLFLLPLDRRGGWYRYHQLFRDLLRLELSREDPDVVARLHERAAAWLLEHGLAEEAFRELSATGDPGKVAALLRSDGTRLLREGHAGTVLTWVRWLPDELLRREPVAAVSGALGSILLGRPHDELARHLAVAEAAAPEQDVPTALWIETACALGRSVGIHESLSAAVEHARCGVDAARRQGDEFVVVTLAVLAYSLYLQGELEEATSAIAEALARAEAPRRPHGFIYATACQALVECERGRVRAAESTARRSLEASRSLGLAGAWSAGLARAALGQALLAGGKAAESERQLERAESLRRSAEPTLEYLHAQVLLIEARLARGRLALAAAEQAAVEEALASFSDAGRLPTFAARTSGLVRDSLAQAGRPVEPPTAAELSVLCLLPSDLSQRQIAQELFLSVNTVKTHSRNLYRKLGARTRDEAVRRAAEAGLLG